MRSSRSPQTGCWGRPRPCSTCLTGLDAHTERYEHFGDVRYFVRDLDTIPARV